MWRSNTFVIKPDVPDKRELLVRLLDASASLWNQLNYERRQNFIDTSSDQSVWQTTDYNKCYDGVLGAATAQQVTRRNDEAWRSFFALKETDEASGLPGYWGNAREGRKLRTYIRNDQYTIQWGEPSTIEIPIGRNLKEEYGLGTYERLTLCVQGKPVWSGKSGRLELHYDELDDEFRAYQPVRVAETPSDAPRIGESAAADIGANVLVACTTSTGLQFSYDGDDLFTTFHETTEEIARLQSLLEKGQYTSKRIRRLYRRRSRRRDHARDALIRDLMRRLQGEDILTLYVGDLTGVLERHWSVTVNEKTHSFWAPRTFVHRLTCVAEEFGINLEIQSEAWTSQTCPDCRSTTETTRRGALLTCGCGFEGHADLAASKNFLRNQGLELSRPMARPVCLKWDDHTWSASSSANRPNEEHTNPKVTTGKAT